MRSSYAPRYADLNRVVVGYSITGPSGRTFNSFAGQPALTTAGGVSLSPLQGAGTALIGATSGQAAAFDAADVATTTAPLALRMTIPSIQAMEAVTGTPPATQPCEHRGAAYQNPGSSAGAVQAVDVTGPFTFAFTVPVAPSMRTADLDETAKSSHGTAVTLERIVVTPSEVRVFVRGPATLDLAGGPPIAPILYVDGKEIDGSVGRPLGGGREADSFVTNLADNHDAWSLKVLTDPTMTNGSRSYTDSVTFQIKVP